MLTLLSAVGSLLSFRVRTFALGAALLLGVGFMIAFTSAALELITFR